jgi:penicillin G amidase
MQNWLKYTIGITFSFITLLVIGGAITYYMITSSVPKYNDDLLVEGLRSDVTIYRDSLAIPYIKAQTEEDALFSLGFLHAQERLFQMDIARRAAEGKLSEVFGEETLLFDKMFLTVGIKRIAERNFNLVSPVTKRNLTAYSKGVNAFINSRSPLPIEFDLLDYTPSLWKPEHSLMIIRMMAWELNIAWWTDITFTRLIQKFGSSKAEEILPDYPENAPTVIPSTISKNKLISSSFIDLNKKYRDFFGITGTHIGSNNWVVNSKLSNSNNPIIANDPHLAYQVPGKWYAVVINANGLKVAGVSLPGIPGVVIGKNENISWVLTNVMADEADFYYEKIDIKKKKYFFNNEWKNLIVIKENIEVKNSNTIQFEVLKTHRGPIISDIHLFPNMYNDTKHFSKPISMKWIGSDFSDEYLSFISINKAKNWSDFKSALSSSSVPGQNFVYADKSGNIGYLCGAKIPIRPSNSTTFVFDGSNENNDWKGFVSNSQMPMLFNPPENFIASANNKPVKNFPYHISNLWEPSSRIERITELLSGKKNHSVKDFMKYQSDLVSPYAKEISKYLINAFDGLKITDQNLKVSLELIKEWDYSFDAYLQAPAIYALFFKYLLKNLLEDELGWEFYSEYAFVANVPYRSVRKILEQNRSTFIDNKRTKKIENRDVIIRESFVDALSFLEQNYGSNLQHWQWGRIHTVTFKHFLGGQSGILDKIINIGPYGIGGDGTTIFNTEYSLVPYNGKMKKLGRKDFSNNLGPSMRYIYDFANPDEFYLVLPTGQSGNIFSSHFKDQTEMWLSGKYIKVKTDEESFTRNSNITRLLVK